MGRLALIVVVGAGIATHAGVAAAQSATVNVTLSPQGQALATAIGTTPTDLSNQVKTAIDNAYQTNNVAGFLRSFTDATEFSNRGLGVDYATLSNDIMIGIAGNVAVSSPDAVSNSDHPTGGAAVNFGGMLGFNLGGAGLPRWTIFGNGFYEGDSTDKLSGHLTSVGGHLQYRLIQPEADTGSAVVLRWIGLDITSGVEYTHWTLGANDGISNNFVVGGTTASETLTLSSTGMFNLTTNTLTIPVEVSTGMRIVELLSIYVGGGMDFTPTGKTTVDGALNGTLSASGQQGSLGTVSIAMTGSNTGSPAVFHGFLGLQLNLWRLKVFVQGNASQTPAASVSFGLRLLL